MLRLRTLFVVLVILGLPATGFASSAVVGGQSNAVGAASLTREVPLEQLLLREINTVRTTRGLARLASSSALSRSAVAHSRAMATYGFFSHDSRNGASFSERIKRFYTPHASGWTVGENLAMFGGTTPSASAIVSAWMASPGHRANLLRDVFHEAGIAIMFNPAAGGVFGGESTWVITLDLGSR